MTNSLDDQILAAVRAGHASRAQLMAIESLRLMTWAAVNERLKALTKAGSLVSTSTGWRLA
jgi:hypothetical protein